MLSDAILPIGFSAASQPVALTVGGRDTTPTVRLIRSDGPPRGTPGDSTLTGIVGGTNDNTTVTYGVVGGGRAATTDTPWS